MRLLLDTHTLLWWLRLVITMEHALHIGKLPSHHNDPFDRMLIAQALLENLTVITRDAQFELYNVSTITA